MKALHPELKKLEAEILSIADFSGLSKAKTGGKAIKSVIDAECGSKTANKKVVAALKNIGEVADSSNEEVVKVETPKTPTDAIKKMGETAVKNMEKLKEVVSPTPKKKAAPKPAAPAAPEPSKEDTSEISQLM